MPLALFSILLALFITHLAPILLNKMVLPNANTVTSLKPSSLSFMSLISLHEALATANYLINHMPKPSLSNTSPYECLYTHRSDYTHLRPFGCLAYPWLRPHTQHKLQLRSTPCIFLGYHPSIKGYKCFEPISQKTYVSRHIRFIEEDFPYPRLSSVTATSNPLGITPIFPPSSHGLVPAPINPSIIHTPPNPNTLIPSGSPSTHNLPIPPIFNPPH